MKALIVDMTLARRAVETSQAEASPETSAILQGASRVPDIVARLSQVLPTTKVARYLQIENKIRSVLRYDLVSVVPLVP